MTIIVHTPAGAVPGEIAETAQFCMRVQYHGAVRPDGDWFDLATGKRNGDSSVYISKEPNS